VQKDDPGLIAALAIADGAPLDWTDATPGSAGSSPLAPELRFLEAVLRAHRSLCGLAGPPEESESLLHPAERNTRASDETVVTWGPLTILEKIGRGSFGVVYRTWDPRLDREVALMLLRHPPVGPDPLGTAVVEEGQLLARVRHPNVMTVYGADRIDGRAGLWMEFVDGHTLADEVRGGGPMAPGEVSPARRSTWLRACSRTSPRAPSQSSTASAYCSITWPRRRSRSRGTRCGTSYRPRTCRA